MSRFYWMTESARWDKGVNSIGWCKRLRELKDITPRVPEDTFSEVATRLSRSAEPSRQVCWLQSARLLSLVASPFNRTTIPWFFPSFPFRASYLHSHPSEGYANLAILTSFLSHNQSVFKGLIIYFLSLFWLVPYLWMAMQRYGFFLEPPNFKMW